MSHKSGSFVILNEVKDLINLLQVNRFFASAQNDSYEAASTLNFITFNEI
jgi:hypothetical protein